MPLSTFFNLPEEKRLKILDCAIDEFACHDYNSASVSKIVAEAKIAKGSLYQYFADKQDLHNYLLKLAAEKKQDMLTAFKSPEPGLSVFETLRLLFQVMMTFEIQYPKLAKIGYRAVHGSTPMPEELMGKAKHTTSEYFRVLIEEGQQTGEIRREVDSGLAAFIFSNALAGMSEYLQNHSMPELLEEDSTNDAPLQASDIELAFSQVISILKNGIAANGADRET